MPLSQGPPSEDPPSEDAYAADQEDTGEDEDEDTDDEMWNWDPRPNVTSQLSGGRAADPLLPDDVQRTPRGRSSYESVGGEVEQRERERRRHEMRSRSPVNNISTRLVQPRKWFGDGWELTIRGGQSREPKKVRASGSFPGLVAGYVCGIFKKLGCESGENLGLIRHYRFKRRRLNISNVISGGRRHMRCCEYTYTIAILPIGLEVQL